jgi:hypothetical protein
VKRLKAGPELKMPKLKVPDFLVDLYWDLRDRHLLPLVALLIVAIIAVPFLLGGGSKQTAPQASPVAGASAAPSPEPVGSKLTVVESKPGLRDYRKRLRHDSPTDPFVQRFTSPDLKGTKLAGGEGASTSSTSSTSTSTTSTTTTSTTTEGDSGSPTVTTNGNGEPTAAGVPGHKKLVLFAFAIDVKITKTAPNASNGEAKEESEVRHGVVPPAPLPSEKMPVIAYMGISPKTRLPYFVVSDAVTGVFGDGKCLSGASACQVIELEPGIPETFVLGDGPRYKINVLDVEPVVAGHIE